MMRNHLSKISNTTESRGCTGEFVARMILVVEEAEVGLLRTLLTDSSTRLRRPRRMPNATR